MAAIWFDEPRPGRTFGHAIGRTATGNILFATTLDAEYMEGSGYRRILVRSTFGAAS